MAAMVIQFTPGTRERNHQTDRASQGSAEVIMFSGVRREYPLEERSLKPLEIMGSDQAVTEPPAEVSVHIRKTVQGVYFLRVDRIGRIEAQIIGLDPPRSAYLHYLMILKKEKGKRVAIGNDTFDPKEFFDFPKDFMFNF